MTEIYSNSSQKSSKSISNIVKSVSTQEDRQQLHENELVTTPFANQETLENSNENNSLIAHRQSDESSIRNRVFLPDHLFEPVPTQQSTLSQLDSLQAFICLGLFTFIAFLLITSVVALSYLDTLKKNKPPNPTFVEDPRRNYRLPPHLAPIHYFVDLQPELTPTKAGNYFFKGISLVEFKVLQPTPYIVVHSYRLRFQQIQIFDDKNIELLIKEYEAFEPMKFLVIKLTKFLKANHRYVLKTSYKSKLSKNLLGFYQSSYKNKNGKNIVIAASQLETTFARNVFPCFDEPALKATFDVSIWHYPQYFALSNMPNISTVPMFGKWLKTSFKRTVKMSTYLLAFIVCDFKYLESFTKNSIQVRIYARPKLIENGNGNFSKKMTPLLLDFFQNFLEISYPLSKSDQVALPEFANLAMENWGLITYAENTLLTNANNLLTDANKNYAEFQKLISLTISHEIGHQKNTLQLNHENRRSEKKDYDIVFKTYKSCLNFFVVVVIAELWFGNLVTPKWWDEAWLNEGFATYFQYLGVNEIKPSWKMIDQFIADVKIPTMASDSKFPNVTVVPPTPGTDLEINRAFNYYTYRKGACLVRMIHGICGDEGFKVVLKNYLNKNAYDAVDRFDLYQELEKTIKQFDQIKLPSYGIEKLLELWLRQPGFPIVTMARIKKTNKIAVTQKIQPENNNLPKSMYGYHWIIPLWYIKQGNSEKQLTFLQKNQTEGKNFLCEIFIASDANNKLVPMYLVCNRPSVGQKDEVIVPFNNYFVGNYEAFGYYRVNYDLHNWNLIALQLKNNYKEIEVKTRGVLLDDAYQLFRLYLVPVQVVLNLTQFLHNDTEYLPWQQGINIMNFFDYYLTATPVYKAFQKYALHLIERIYNHVTWIDDGLQLKQFQRKSVIELACKYGLSHCVGQSKIYYQAWVNETETLKIPAFLRETVLCNGLRYGNEREWNLAIDRLKNSSFVNDKRSIENSLTCTRIPALVTKFFKMWKVNKIFQLSDPKALIERLCSNMHVRNITWFQLKTNISSFGPELIASCAASFNLRSELEELKKLENSATDGNIAWALKKVKSSVIWLEKYQDDIAYWLDEKLSELGLLS